ncbi:1-acylglycerol-3-phosphate O-acyltransferase abhd5 [Dermatophagoides farinae]|uniref:1-acylglycerol-3-phosphate O-acyltransferase abhd5 n=1 Tax=Dermatophagoides farinae TaxID=6954 RepID=A0A922LA00_DERFA|nr:1-acylglycerol-3-phosphate O-acyltransferase abhd5 [Dermatophagoides farinae]
MSFPYDLKANVRRSHSSPSSVSRLNFINRQRHQDYDENDADDEYRDSQQFNPNETYYDSYRRQQLQQQQSGIGNNKISLNRRSSFIHHRHSFHHPQDYYYEHPDFVHFTSTESWSFRWTATLAIISVQRTTALFIQWILYPFYSFTEYFRLLFHIITNLFFSLLQFYAMILAFACDYLGLGHFASSLLAYLNSRRIWQQHQQLLQNSKHCPDELYSIKRSISCGDNLDIKSSPNRYSIQSRSSFRGSSGTITAPSNTGQLVSFFKSASKLPPTTSDPSTCPCCNRLDQERRQRSISLVYPSSSSHRQQSSGSTSLRRHHSQSSRCHNHNGHCHNHQHHIHNRYDLFDALNLPTPTVVNVLIKPIIQTILDWTQVNTVLSLTWKMKRRVRKLFRWCPTSPEELNEAEDKVLSYLKCNYQTYYVDIGSRWDLDHVRIWTLEIEPDSMVMTSSDDENREVQPPDLLPKVGLKNQHYLPPKMYGLPLVMIHGFAAGIGLWALNIDELARRGNRPIFAFDLLGFAKSSRPRFPMPRFPRNLTETQRIKAEAEQMENYYVECLEKWRQSIGEPLSNKFILLGHSFGAYIAMAYALKHPSHVAHVILADAWGIPPETQSRHLAASGHITTRQLPWWAKLIGRMFLDILNPLSLLRAIGPWGPFVLNSARADIKYKFERLTKGIDQPWKRFSAAKQAENPPPLESSDELSSDELDSIDGQLDESSKPIKSSKNKEKEKPCVFLNYIYHCNAQSRPSGEIAFKKLCSSTGWARLPILDRIQDLDPRITLTFIYGSRSWIDRQTGLQAKYILATKSVSGGVGNHPRILLTSSDENSDGDDDLIDLDGLQRKSRLNIERVEVHVIQGAGHHVYADKPEEFNDLILSIAEQIDQAFMKKIPYNSEQDIDSGDQSGVNGQMKKNLRINNKSLVIVQQSSTTPSSSGLSMPLSQQQQQQQQRQQQSTESDEQMNVPRIRPGRKYGNYIRPPKFLSNIDQNMNDNGGNNNNNNVDISGQ